MSYNEYRRKPKPVQVGRTTVGGDAPVSVQSMTNTKTSDIEATVAQIRALQSAGCDIVRMAVPDADAVRAFGVIREQIPDFPLVADIHFDYRLAVGCAEAGADKIRINPGNIGDTGARRGVGLPSAEHPHPHRRERRLSGKAYFGAIRRAHSRSTGAKCNGACASAGAERLL